MPSLASITNNFFVNLINRLGVRPPPAEGFMLSNVVQPVSIVDSDIVLTSISTTVRADTSFSQGEIASPVGAAALLADTGQQPAGTYNLFITIAGSMGAGAGDFQIQRRNAANAANVWQQTGNVGVNFGGLVHVPLTVVLLTNERIRILTKNAWTVGSTAEANIWLQPVT